MRKKENIAKYNYEHFRLSHYGFDLAAGPKEGEVAPDFVVTTLGGKEVRLSGYLGRPVVLESGSITCNVFVQKLPLMNALTEAFPECHYLVLYGREAHPGAHIPRHASFEEKNQRAHMLKELEHERRTILVDDLAGTAHQLYGALPNFIYIIDAQGKVVFKDKWGSPERVKRVLLLLRQNNSQVNTANIHAINCKYDMGCQLKTTWRVFRRAGYVAMWDFVKEMATGIFKYGLKNKPN